MFVKVCGIVYDTDGEVVDLPSELELEVDTLADVSDAISNKTGWCVSSYSVSSNLWCANCLMDIDHDAHPSADTFVCPVCGNQRNLE